MKEISRQPYCNFIAHVGENKQQLGTITPDIKLAPKDYSQALARPIQPPHPDLTPSDFHLFLHLKSFLAGKHFNNDKELKENVSNWLKTQAATFYEEGIEKLVPRYDTCLQNFGSYVER
ncbi:histone-lysine N-methyltransferase SETMAR [Trichonephila clavipes]|nr:histone-lysine N-methyltransferase SETMAR [Trichonephila clavipes]